MSPSLLCLSLALLAVVLLSLLRTGRPPSLRAWLLGMVMAMMLLLVGAAVLWPTASSYKAADSVRIVEAAASKLRAQAEKADCIVFFDGSSVSVYALDLLAIQHAFEAHGLSVCLVPLVNHGAGHFERELMAEQLRRALPDKLRQVVDRKPVLWVKELCHYYETIPARFNATNADTPRVLAMTSPSRVVPMLKSIVTNWQHECRKEKLSGWAAWATFPTDRFAATFDQGLFNLFQTGALQRRQTAASEALFVLAERSAAPSGKLGAARWAKVPPADYQPKVTNALEFRDWFKDLLKRAPSHWPQRPGFKLILNLPPAMGETIPKYGAMLAAKGTGTKLSVINGAADAALVRSMYRPELWADMLHMNHDGATLYSEWLATKLEPEIRKLQRTLQVKPPYLQLTSR